MPWTVYNSDGKILQSAEVGNDSITNAKMADDAVDSAEIVAGAIDLAHMSANSIDSTQYVDGSIDLAHMSVNSIDSDQYVDGSIDLAHMSVNSIDSDQYVDGSIDLAHMSVNSVDSDQYVDRSIDTVHIGLNQVTLAEMAGITRGSVIYGNASGNPTALALGASGLALKSDGTDLVYGAAGGNASLFGDSSDGTVTISSAVTLSANMEYAALTISSSGSLDTAGYRVQVAGTLTVNSGCTIHTNGAAGTADSGGTSMPGGVGRSNTTYGGSSSGGASGAANGNNGVAGSAAAISLGGHGGDSGHGGTGGTGALGGLATRVTEGYGAFSTLPTLKKYEGSVFITGGAGGAGGGGSLAGNKGAGGAGGAGGGVLVLFADAVVNNGTISSNGGNGNTAHSNGTGGGGGGGGGGYVLIITDSYTGSGTATANGGTGGLNGTNSATGLDGIVGGTGVVEIVDNSIPWTLGSGAIRPPSYGRKLHYNNSGMGSHTTTSSTALVVVDSANWTKITLSTGANPINYGGTFTHRHGTLGNSTFMNVKIDSTFQLWYSSTEGGATNDQAVAGNNMNLSFSGQSEALTAGTHTVEWYWKVSANTGTMCMAPHNPWLGWAHEIK